MVFNRIRLLYLSTRAGILAINLNDINDEDHDQSNEDVHGMLMELSFGDVPAYHPPKTHGDKVQWNPLLLCKILLYRCLLKMPLLFHFTYFMQPCLAYNITRCSNNVSPHHLRVNIVQRCSIRR